VSWDFKNEVSTITAPSTRVFPLFLHLSGVQDVKRLAVTLQWTPFDSAGCYHVVSASPQSSSGWATAISPGTDFEGDSTYSWSLLFPPHMRDRSCVVYWISMAACDSAPRGRFHVLDVRVKDSNGAIDMIKSRGDATIRGGALPDTLVPPSSFSTSSLAVISRLTLAATPNPASGTAVFRYSLPASMPGTILVFDVFGRLVRHIALPLDRSPSGSFSWDFRDDRGQLAGTGVYFVQLVTPVGAQCARLAVLR
jgi:hypothetical protein